MTAFPLLLLSRKDLAALMTPADYLGAVEEAFLAAKDGRAHSPPPMHIPAIHGGFHAKGARLTGSDGDYVAVKINGNFPGNRERTGLPTIQGAVLLSDAHTGSPLALLDSIEITLQRTAAASALAARCLARAGASTLALCGCGDQARAHVRAMCEIFPFKRAFAWDVDGEKAARFSEDMAAATGITFTPEPHLADATLKGDVIVTCTTARAPFLTEEHVSPGAFIAAVGADHADKGEIAPSLMARAVVVADVIDQCAVMGDTRWALAAGAIQISDLRGELGDVLTGACAGRERESDIIIFDSTGTALQDVAAAAQAYENAKAFGRGSSFTLS